MREGRVKGWGRSNKGCERREETCSNWWPRGKSLKQVERKNGGSEGGGKGLDSLQVGFGGIGELLGTCVTDMEIYVGDFILNLNMRVREFVQAFLINFVRILILFDTIIAPIKKRKTVVYLFHSIIRCCVC